MKIFFIVLFLQATIYSFGQNLLGVWQENSPVVTSGYHNVYQFNNDGTFKFKTDEYFGLNRIISINGTYKVLNSFIHLNITSTTEFVGGTVERSITSGEASDSWELVGGKVKTIQLAKPVNINFLIQSKESDYDDAELMIFDKKKYYKIK
jgi:hypothetical protein